MGGIIHDGDWLADSSRGEARGRLLGTSTRYIVAGSVNLSVVLEVVPPLRAHPHGATPMFSVVVVLGALPSW